MQVLRRHNEFEKWFEGSGHQTRLDLLTPTPLTMKEFQSLTPALTSGVYLAFLREKRGVIVTAYRNASGYLWGMQMEDSGTDLGWCGFSGNDKNSMTFTTYDLALFEAIYLELEYGNLENFQKESKYSHWRSYADYLKEQCAMEKEKAND